MCIVFCGLTFPYAYHKKCFIMWQFLYLAFRLSHPLPVFWCVWVYSHTYIRVSLHTTPFTHITHLSISGAKVSSHVSPSPSTTTEAETSSNSSGTSQSGVVDEASPEGRSRLQHALLEVVYGLSSDVSLKKNTLGLNM